jgi:hypothetical protein
MILVLSVFRSYDQLLAEFGSWNFRAHESEIGEGGQIAMSRCRVQYRTLRERPRSHKAEMGEEHRLSGPHTHYSTIVHVEALRRSIES